VHQKRREACSKGREHCTSTEDFIIARVSAEADSLAHNRHKATLDVQRRSRNLQVQIPTFSDGSLKTITEGTIKFTCPLEFNDPFDCLPYYDKRGIAQVTRMRPDLFKAAGDRRGLSPAQRLMQKPQFISRLKSRIEDGSFARDLIKDVGVVSFEQEGVQYSDVVSLCRLSPRICP